MRSVVTTGAAIARAGKGRRDGADDAGYRAERERQACERRRVPSGRAERVVRAAAVPEESIGVALGGRGVPENVTRNRARGERWPDPFDASQASE